jgi:hypothetical protein
MRVALASQRLTNLALLGLRQDSRSFDTPIGPFRQLGLSEVENQMVAQYADRQNGVCISIWGAWSAQLDS